MKHTGCDNSSDSVPWRDTYPEYSESQLIGKVLAGASCREGLTQISFSKLTGIPQRHITEMETGKRPEMAKHLGKALDIDYKLFL